ncbi:FIG00821261: hypothetical protein [hydrothermal vent metagenome]|uniref:Methyltransferase domain-containing protein n=1 Tax=hydrothermal vent metagenome TaxID=652676 RepID=A0A3B1DVS4_9ZZZZ
MTSPASETTRWFRNRYYFRLNQRRFEHLTQLELPLRDRQVLEVGAGIGDHTTYFLDRGCRVTATEGRSDNLAYLAARFEDHPEVTTALLDLDEPTALEGCPWEVGYCYGVLYHLMKPAEALAFISPQITDMLLLETVCALGEETAVNLVKEDTNRSSQSLRGTGCRTTRPWVMHELRKHFAHVYTTTTQPWHPEFADTWSAGPSEGLTLSRAVFVASRTPILNTGLTEELPMTQARC